jgi:molybdenum-dependent DNA-binding transcriptional regulator ModE
MDSVKHGMHLTDEAKELMDCFDQLERDIAHLLNKASGKLPLKRS